MYSKTYGMPDLGNLGGKVKDSWREWLDSVLKKIQGNIRLALVTRYNSLTEVFKGKQTLADLSGS
jgi:hypothetical protein